MLNQLQVRPKVFWLTLLVACLLNIGLATWLRQNTLAAFKVSEYVNSPTTQINDWLYSRLTKDKELISFFNQIIDETPAHDLILSTFLGWKYKSDFILWDAANPPMIAFAEMTGDCDDFARLMSYMLSRKADEGYNYVRFVTMVFKKDGHAATVFYNERLKKIGIVDNNDVVIHTVESFDEKRDIPRLVLQSYDDMTHLAVWDAQMTKILWWYSTKGQK